MSRQLRISAMFSVLATTALALSALLPETPVPTPIDAMSQVAVATVLPTE